MRGKIINSSELICRKKGFYELFFRTNITCFSQVGRKKKSFYLEKVFSRKKVIVTHESEKTSRKKGPLERNEHVVKIRLFPILQFCWQVENTVIVKFCHLIVLRPWTTFSQTGNSAILWFRRNVFNTQKTCSQGFSSGL